MSETNSRGGRWIDMPHVSMEEAITLLHRLRAALEEQWQIAHDEHCTNMRDCASFGGSKECSHPRPAFLSSAQSPVGQQPRLTVRLTTFPESNGKRNWTALLVRVEEWGGLVGNCGGITVAHGELWNRVAYHAECAKLLIGERDTEPHILDYGDDIQTPDEWAGEVRGGRPVT